MRRYRRVLSVAAGFLTCLAATCAGAAAAPWLGLDYNSGTPNKLLDDPAHVDDFVADGIVYDRESAEPIAGQTVQPAYPGYSASFARELRADVAAHMIPDIEIDLDPELDGNRGCTHEVAGEACLPTTASDVSSYVIGFLATAGSVLQAYPRRQVLFEPMDEPWYLAAPAGTPQGYTAAAEYAAVLAQLLPAAREQGIPLRDIYVPAAGQLGEPGAGTGDGTYWITDLYEAEPCLAPGAGSCVRGAPATPIAGWNLHPYGLPSSRTEGIGSVPGIRDGMLSGEDNIIVSEIGFCEPDLLDRSGRNECNQNRADVDGDGAQVAAWLTQTLVQAQPMHEAGWLKALIIWNRSGGGWSMQNLDGTLTAQGQALVAFAGGPRGPSIAVPPPGGVFGANA